MAAAMAQVSSLTVHAFKMRPINCLCLGTFAEQFHTSLYTKTKTEAYNSVPVTQDWMQYVFALMYLLKTIYTIMT